MPKWRWVLIRLQHISMQVHFYPNYLQIALLRNTKRVNPLRKKNLVSSLVHQSSKMLVDEMVICYTQLD